MIILRKLQLIFITIILCYVNVSNAQNHYIEKEFKLSLKQSGQYALLSLDLAEGVKAYWLNSGELGVATKINFDKSNNLEDAKIFWPIPELYKVENVISYIYQGKKDFSIKPIAKKTNKDILLTVNISFTTCKDSCSNHDFTLAIKMIHSTNEEKTAEIIQALAKTPYDNGTEAVRILSVTQEKIDEQDFLKIKFSSLSMQENPTLFLDLPEYVSFEPLHILLTSDSNEQLFTVPIKLLDGKKLVDRVYLNLLTDNGHAIEYETLSIDEDEYSFFWIIIYALLGGLILNVMPCVLPILALKALQLIKLSGQSKVIIKKSLLAQALGIIISFLSLAFITYGLQQFGEHVGMGMQFQQPLYLITMVIILSVISINLIENIELNISIPQIVVKTFSSEQKDVIGFFLSGVLSTMLAIPCTAPFITIAMGFAITASFFKMLLIFLFIGLGMASPYIALSLYPAIGKCFPKSGEWMIKTKKILGIVIFGTSIWLMYVISTQLGNKAAITLFLLIILIKFILTERKFFDHQVRFILTIMLMLLCYFVPYHLYEEKHQEELLVEDVWRDYKPSEISALIEKDYIILLDVTASWCATCKINKITTLDNTIVMDFMVKRGIIGMRADISAGTTSEVSTLMKINHHYGIPLCMIYSKKFPKGLVLPTFLTPNSLINSLKKAGS